ncbi:MAG TPA: hypothetical protein P5150_06880 [Candidatus Ratteibacteria bacterium]|nr:hypothetical protein [bacterium]HRR96433.1 hypothetical protein [Candidatus Ratteibacteria bacterium]
MEEISNFISNIKKESIKNQQILYFCIDIDINEFWIEQEKKEKNKEEEIGEEEEIEKYQTSFDFILCKNTDEEKGNGIMKFKIFPDGYVQPGFIYINDPETNIIWTIFINPYLNIPEIYEGEVTFEEYQ